METYHHKLKNISSSETLSNECYFWCQTTCNVTGKHVHQRKKQCNIVPYMNSVRESAAIMIGNFEQKTNKEQTSPELLAACHLSVDDVCMLSNVLISCSLSVQKRLNLHQDRMTMLMYSVEILPSISSNAALCYMSQLTLFSASTFSTFSTSFFILLHLFSTQPSCPDPFQLLLHLTSPLSRNIHMCPEPLKYNFRSYKIRSYAALVFSFVSLFLTLNYPSWCIYW